MALPEQGSCTRLSHRSVEKLRGVGGGDEIESLRWGWRAGGSVVAAAKQDLHISYRPPSQADVHHGSHQHPNHVMEEPISLDGEAHPPTFWAKLPLGVHEPAAMMRLVYLGRKRPEVVFSQYHPGRDLE